MPGLLSLWVVVFVIVFAACSTAESDTSIAPTISSATIKIGARSRAYVVTRVLDNPIHVPSEAVVVKAGKTFLVYVKVGDDTFAARPVKVGATVDGQVAILGGLEAGQVVVVKGALLLDGVSEQQPSR